MKRSIAIIFALLYIGSVSGWALNLHYCGGELNCISLLVKDDCCTCPEEDEPGCCSDEGLYIKASDDSHTAGNSITFSQDAALVASRLTFSIPTVLNLPNCAVHPYCAFDLPPPDRLILFRTFLI
jgi:hypothetical protein